jgi:ribosomal subunit interface protein
MTFHIAGKNMDIGEALRSHAEQRIGSAIEKFFGRGSNTHVVVEHEGTGFRAECTVHLDSGSVLSAQASNHDARLAFDQAADKLETQLRRYKEKLRDHTGKDSATLPAERPASSD